MTGHERWGILLSMAVMLLGGCFLPSRTVEPKPFSDPEARISTIALMRATWDGTRPDPFCQPDIGDEIDRHLKWALEKSGYKILSFQVPDLDNSNRPDPVASWSSSQLKDAAPEGADAIMRLRIVEYLDASLCDSGYEIKSLNITGIAEIYSTDSRLKLWETRQLCSDLSKSTRDVVFTCTTELARGIVGRLPPPTR